MLAGLIVLCALAAEPGLDIKPLGPARPGCVLRVTLRLRDAPPGPLELTADLLDGSTLLATAAVSLPGGDGQAIVVLTPAGTGSGRLRLRATATWAGPGHQPRTLSAETAVATHSAALADIVSLVARLRAGGRNDPLPWLWAEQVAELCTGGASAASLGEVAALGARLAAWLADPQPPGPGASEQALRDPVDGSVQPYRLHLPAGSGPFPLLVLLPAAEPGLGKARWPSPDARLVEAALAAGCAVIVCYPAGDRAWDGAARRRIALTVAAAAAQASLDPSRGACVGSADATGLPYTLHRSPTTPDAAWAQSILGPRLPSPPGHTGWADAPFAVVVGSAEHAAAVTANRSLAESFRSAYAAHAHAVVELLDDDVDDARLAGRNLVLIGNPRSNRLLARLAPALPFTWDHRVINGPAGFSALRSRLPSLACQVQLPNEQIALILDGAPPPWGPGLPLDGLTLPFY